MTRHEVSTIFATLGQLAVEILVILYVQPLFFFDFTLNSNVFIDIHEYVNKIICISTI